MRDMLRMLARRLGAVVAECNYAQHRIAQLNSSLDGYLPDPDLAPDSFQEFLLRTSGPLMHEPKAARRSTRPALR
jgi:hypothetical protein